MMSCLMLEQFGFTDVTNVTGGMLAWQDKIGG
jgi:rhodanese-related sulfurtransferase